MKIVALVPIKMNNERLPGKNTKRFSNGKPLISYILNTLSSVKGIDEIYVYCSNEAIKEYLPSKIKFLKREEYLDLSTTTCNKIFTSFAEKIEADIYVVGHATAPFLEAKRFESAIDAIKNHGYDSALTVTKMQDFLWKDGKPFNYDPTSIPRTQDLPTMYVETTGMYVYTKEVITKRKTRIGYKPFLIEVSQFEACDINNPDDFIMADIIAQQIEKK